MIKEQRFEKRFFYIFPTSKLYHFSESDIKAISPMTGQILSLRICYIVPISEKESAISTLYLFWRKAYQSYIVLENEGGRPQKDMEQLYHSSISGYITFAESSTTVPYPAGYWHKQIRHQIDVLVDDSFYCRRISQTCHFLPQEKFPVKPSALESEIHRVQIKDLYSVYFALPGANSRKRELQMLTHLQ